MFSYEVTYSFVIVAFITVLYLACCYFSQLEKIVLKKEFQKYFSWVSESVALTAGLPSGG